MAQPGRLVLGFALHLVRVVFCDLVLSSGISGAVNTATTISPTAAAGTSGDGNPAVGNSAASDMSAAPDSTSAGISGIAAAGISAAGISGAVVGSTAASGGKTSRVGELLDVGEEEEATMVGMDRIKLSDGDDDDVMGPAGSGSSSSYDDQHRKSLINLTKTRQSPHTRARLTALFPGLPGEPCVAQ